MARSVTSARTLADLPEVRTLAAEEMQQIEGGYARGEVAAVLLAMGWTPYTHTHWDKNGMSSTRTSWKPPA